MHTSDNLDDQLTLFGGKLMDKKTYYVSIPLQRIAAEAYDHTYKFRIAANDVELALLQEKIDQLARPPPPQEG